jgi:hypothetical protein
MQARGQYHSIHFSLLTPQQHQVLTLQLSLLSRGYQQPYQPSGTEALTTPWGHKPALHFEIFFYSMHMLILEIRPTSIYHPIGTYYESTTCTSL